jgi:hypothetical protein
MSDVSGEKLFSHHSATNLNLPSSVNKRLAGEKGRAAGGPSTGAGGAKRASKAGKHQGSRAKHSEAGGEKTAGSGKSPHLRDVDEIGHSAEQSHANSQEPTKRGDNVGRRNARTKVGVKAALKEGSPKPNQTRSDSDPRSRSMKKPAKREPESQSKMQAEKSDSKPL